MDVSPWLMLGLIALVALSGYFSASETAFSSLNKIRIKSYANGGNKRAGMALRMSEEYDRTLSTILIGNNVVNIAATSIGTLICTQLFPGAGGVGIATLVMTVVLLLFGEISPKSLAKDHAEGFALTTAPVLQFLTWVMTPLNLVFLGWKKLIGLVFKGENSRGMTGDELKVIVDEIESEGALNKQESELIRSAIEFNDLSADDILTPRVDGVFAPADCTESELRDLFRQTGFSRIPVYGEDIDDIIGVVYEKDFYNREEEKPFQLKPLLKEALFVPYNMKISLLLTTLQKSKAHMAIVVDQYGGNMGIVTMEDVLEELVGEIWDETDQVVSPVVRQPDGSYLVQGTVRLGDVLEELEIPLEEDDFKSNSIGGFMTELLGCIPAVGDTASCKGWTLRASKADERRVLELQLIPPKQEEES